MSYHFHDLEPWAICFEQRARHRHDHVGQQAEREVAPVDLIDLRIAFTADQSRQIAKTARIVGESRVVAPAQIDLSPDQIVVLRQVGAGSQQPRRGIFIDLAQVAEDADVFVQNFRPGAIQRMGLGEEVIRAIKPDILYVSISGFGDKGPYAHKRVYDPVIQALSGIADIQADNAQSRPRMMRTLIPDKTTGLTAAQAITAGLLSRERTISLGSPSAGIITPLNSPRGAVQAQSKPDK
ncbi:MAG: CoA transferase [Bacteroidetes bacterium]|nr:CoA transferase [Bacteroidota bacterium]